MSVSKHRTKILAAIVLLATFAAGALVGVIGYREFVRRMIERHTHDRATAFVLGRLEKRLDLTPDQTTKIREILDRRHRRMAELRRTIDPKIRAEIEQANKDIAAVLTPEQRAIFEKMKMRLMPRERGHRGPRQPFRDESPRR